MKSLVVAGMVSAMASAAFAQSDPTLCYEFKARVRSTNVKTLMVPDGNGSHRSSPVLVKYIQKTTLRGYVIDPGYGKQVWAVIGNEKVRPAVGHLFRVTLLNINIFDSTGRIMMATGKDLPALDNVQSEPETLRFRAEGGAIMNQGEEWPGDNVIGDQPVNRRYLFGEHDTWGLAWFAMAGFGAAKVNVADEDSVTFGLALRGSLIGGWRDDECGVDIHVAGYGLDELLSGLGEDVAYAFHMSSWISGTWAIRPTSQLVPVQGNYVLAAMRALNPSQSFQHEWNIWEYGNNTY